MYVSTLLSLSYYTSTSQSGCQNQPSLGNCTSRNSNCAKSSLADFCRIGQICAGMYCTPYPLRVPIIKPRDNNNERVVVVLYFTPFARGSASTTHLPPGRHWSKLDLALSLAWVEMHNLAEGRLYWYCSGARPADDVTACPERY